MSSSVTIKELNERLTKKSYLGGYTPNEEDAKCFRELFGDNVNVVQWAARMASYYPSERAQMRAKANNEDADDNGDDDSLEEY